MSRSAQVNESSVEESQKRGRVNGEDRVSNLPESIISHILSCLPTKDVIRTCVLSKDWEYKWTSIYNIDIDDDRDFTRNDITTMVAFVEMILLFTQNIKKFHFSCDREGNLGRHVPTWISTVLRRNVESLQLICREISGIVLPRSLINNSSLRKLDLVMSFCTFKVPSTNCFPNLTSLCFSGVEFQNKFSNTDKLIFTFPVLERFELCYCQWKKVKSVEIFAPSLRSLISVTNYDVAIPNYSIKIFGPKLVNFEFLGGSMENFIMVGPPVAKAVLELDDLDEEDPPLENYGLQFRKLLKEFSSLEELQLTYWVTKAIANTKQELALPMYNKLRKLSVDSGTNIGALMELLHSAPSLTILILSVDPDYYDNDHDDDYNFDAVEFVPSCIVSQLEEVTLCRYPRATGLASFLLKNGTKLKKFRVKASYLRCDVDRDALKNAIMEEVSTVPKASACVSVVVE